MSTLPGKADIDIDLPESLFFENNSLFDQIISLFHCAGNLGQRGRDHWGCGPLNRGWCPKIEKFTDIFPVSREFWPETGPILTASPAKLFVLFPSPATQSYGFLTLPKPFAVSACDDLFVNLIRPARCDRALLALMISGPISPIGNAK
jgi:hypothetical protein